MKLILISLLLATVATAQSPTPTPFDALGLSAATPIPNSAKTLAQKQSDYQQRVLAQSRAMFQQLKSQYTVMLALTTSDDSVDSKGNPLPAAAAGLTPAQKLAALTTDQQTELLTNAWLIANLLNGVAPGTVQNPPMK